jgi:hypothetical protein
VDKIEYDNKLEEIEEISRLAKKNLNIEYAKSKRICAVGDVIKSNNGTLVIVQNIGTYIGFCQKYPEPTYSGIELKKNLEPKLNGRISTIYGNDGTELIKKNSQISIQNKTT